ncbi:DUF550 domain-containing protein [Salmonella enterica subsp. enterica serovar Schwarzengrund]|nr:DUF550 domain-containing protein [Salmonella enterica subsp. enterica serovar Schwarzengrund]
MHQLRETLSQAAAQSDGGNLCYAMADAVKVIDGAMAREQVRREHAEWSDATFGNVGPVGPLKHLSKEALETAAEPGDLSEWADMQFLLWDAQRRAGITDEDITHAMVEKLAVNKQREWPEPKDGEPRLHIKEHEIETHTLLKNIEGMEVSIDVSTCDADAGHRYFGTVTEISELDTAKNGYILLVQDAKPNFKQDGYFPVTPESWIPVSERMPLQGDYVSVVSRHGEFASGQVNGDWLDLQDGTSFRLNEVLLWILLPPLPPQEEKQ